MQKRNVQAAGLLFDMDGVLVSSIASVTRSWRKWAAHYGLPNADTFEVTHGVRALDLMLAAKPDVDPVEGLKIIEDIEVNDVADTEVLAGARALLASLPLERWAIVTSATYRLLVARLEAAGLPVPENIVSADRVTNGKPHPEPYEKGAALIHAAPSECVVFEDAPSGVGAGVAAGCRVLGVLGTHSEEELRAAGATWVVRSLEAVKALSTEDGLQLEFIEA